MGKSGDGGSPGSEGQEKPGATEDVQPDDPMWWLSPHAEPGLWSQSRRAQRGSARESQRPEPAEQEEAVGQAEQEGVPKVILDPSVLFTDEALTWLADAEIRPSLAVSLALWQRLADPAVGDSLRPFGVSTDPDRIGRLRDALREVSKFSHRDVNALTDAARAIRDALLASNEPMPDVLADEWIFLSSQSIGIVAENARVTLDAFERAGGRVYTVADEQMQRALQAIRRRLPRWLLRVMKRFGRLRPPGNVGKLLVFGGNIAVLLLPHVGLPVAIATAIQSGAAVIAGDP
jgi:hypothetical protein